MTKIACAEGNAAAHPLRLGFVKAVFDVFFGGALARMPFYNLEWPGRAETGVSPWRLGGRAVCVESVRGSKGDFKTGRGKERGNWECQSP